MCAYGDGHHEAGQCAGFGAPQLASVGGTPCRRPRPCAVLSACYRTCACKVEQVRPHDNSDKHVRDGEWVNSQHEGKAQSWLERNIFPVTACCVGHFPYPARPQVGHVRCRRAGQVACGTWLRPVNFPGLARRFWGSGGCNLQWSSRTAALPIPENAIEFSLTALPMLLASCFTVSSRPIEGYKSLTLTGTST